MTLKQEMLLKRLPENGFNIAKTTREVGYSEQTARSGTHYAAIRKLVEKVYNPDYIKREIERAKKDFEKAKDNSNRSRMLELQAKIVLKTDQPEQKQGIFVGVYGNELPQRTDIKQDTTTPSVDNSNIIKDNTNT